MHLRYVNGLNFIHKYGNEFDEDIVKKFYENNRTKDGGKK
jgi:hypothetical protein